MHINSLPILVFRLIFSRLPLHDLLLVGRVCALWKEYQLDIASQVHSITLLIDCKTPHLLHHYGAQDLIDRSPFTLHHSNELLNDQGHPLFATQLNLSITRPYLYISTMNQLVDCLANVRTLNISIRGVHCYVIERLIWLLAKWKPKLVTFRLWCCFSEDHVNDPIWHKTPKTMLMPKLIDTLSSLSASLERVDLCGTSITDECDMSALLFRVREFNYEHELPKATFAQVPQWLTQNGNNVQLGRIGLAGRGFVRIVGKLASTSFAGKITVLPKRRHLYSNEEILNNLNRFSSLTSLEVQIEYFPTHLKSMSSLKHLIHLSVKLCGSPRFAEFNRISTNTFAQLPSVKLLSLDASNMKHTSHNNLESPHWGWIFPNIQILSVEHSCIQIRDDVRDKKMIKCPHLDQFATMETVSRAAVRDGMRALVATFEQCPTLRRIYLNDQKLTNTSVPDDLVKFCFDL